MPDLLKVPSQLSRVRIQRNNGATKKVVSWTIVTIEVRIRITGSEDNLIVSGVDSRIHPDCYATNLVNLFVTPEMPKRLRAFIRPTVSAHFMRIGCRKPSPDELP